MALKRKNRINAEFSMSSMTDIVLLLLIFFVITSTLINPNGLQVILPKSNNQASARSVTAVTVTKEGTVYLNEGGRQQQVALSNLEARLQQVMSGKKEPFFTLYGDEQAPYGILFRIQNIAFSNRYKVVLGAQPKR